jgi:glycosyltransferase involved in cell wall biosynthesis
MAIQAEKLARLLAQDGYSVRTVRTNAAPSAKAGLISRIPGLRTSKNLLRFLTDLRKALPHCDVVYFFSGFFHFFFHVTFPGLILINLHRKPVILSARGGDARLFFKRHRKWVAPILRRVDLITTPSGFLQAAFKDTLGLDTTVLPNIADLKQFTFMQRDVFRPRLLVTRNLEPIYDVACVINAFALVAQKYPDAVLTIAGHGSQRAYLEKLAADLALQNKVGFLGQISHDRIQQAYQEHDISVNASRVDNLPGTILEAFACGLPVVSTNAGGIPYLVEHERTGLLSPVGDSQALARNVLRIVAEPGLGRALAAAGRCETAKYSWEHVRPLLREVFKNAGKLGS